MCDLPIELTYFEASFDPRPVRRVYKMAVQVRVLQLDARHDLETNLYRLEKGKSTSLKDRR